MFTNVKKSKEDKSWLPHTEWCHYPNDKLPISTEMKLWQFGDIKIRRVVFLKH